MNTLGIIFISIAALIVVALFVLYTIRFNKESEADRIPGPDEIEIVEDADYHEVTRGDFYIRDSRNDFNPFESYNIYGLSILLQDLITASVPNGKSLNVHSTHFLKEK